MSLHSGFSSAMDFSSLAYFLPLPNNPKIKAKTNSRIATANTTTITPLVPKKLPSIGIVFPVLVVPFASV